MPSKNYDQPAGQAKNTGVFHTRISGSTGMTGSTGEPGSTGMTGSYGVPGNAGMTDNTGVPGTTGLADLAGMINTISMADTTGSSENTNGSDYIRKGMNQMGLSAGSGEGPTAGISGSDGSGIYGVTGRTGGNTDPSNSSIEGGWSLADIDRSIKPTGKPNSFQKLS